MAYRIGDALVCVTQQMFYGFCPALERMRVRKSVRTAVCVQSVRICFNTLTKCMQELLVGSNRLRALAADYFDSTPALKCVDLSHNQLELVPESLLKLINLERLNLDNNDLVFIGAME